MRSGVIVAFTACATVLTLLLGAAPAQRASPCASGQTVIAPCPSVSDTLHIGALATTHGGAVAFTVTNQATGSRSYAAHCAYTSPLTSCTVDQSTVRVEANASARIIVSYSVGASTGSGAVAVRVDGGGADIVDASVAVTVTTP
jgi:hypothetical protein